MVCAATADELGGGRRDSRRIAFRVAAADPAFAKRQAFAGRSICHRVPPSSDRETSAFGPSREIMMPGCGKPNARSLASRAALASAVISTVNTAPNY